MNIMVEAREFLEYINEVKNDNGKLKHTIIKDKTLWKLPL